MKTPYETCWNCEGSGLEIGYNGEPTHCHVCHGDTVVRARDKKGRFTKVEIEEPKAAA